tara:strand:- start:56 stop:340 length:285 start_codon:yes stop_codon:yes gene_type:complete
MIKDVTNDPTQWKRFWESDDGVYHGIANPNATNSELDAKVIITPDSVTIPPKFTKSEVDLIIWSLEQNHREFDKKEDEEYGSILLKLEQLSEEN